MTISYSYQTAEDLQRFADAVSRGRYEPFYYTTTASAKVSNIKWTESGSIDYAELDKFLEKNVPNPCFNLVVRDDCYRILLVQRMWNGSRF